jgi:predicted SprT family Zn-dependent metalloprotease
MMGRSLMNRHGLDDWRLVFDNAVRRAGVCRPGRREIGLSRVLTELHGEGEVHETVLHEIAHALVGAEHGHDAIWRARAAEIGCSGERCVSATAPRPDAPWTGTCPAGHEVSRYRQPVRVQACGRCSKRFDPSTLIAWKYQGRAVPMHPEYVAELARIRHRLGAVDDPGVAVAARASAHERLRGAPAPRLPVGTVVRLGGRGRYARMTGTVVKVGRTRYHISTRAGLVTAPFELVRPV